MPKCEIKQLYFQHTVGRSKIFHRRRWCHWVPD